MPQFKDLVNDIYNFFDDPEAEISEDGLEDFATKIKDHLRKAFGKGSSREQAVISLRASNLGLPSRRLWYNTRYPEKLSPQSKINFLYGNILEEFLLMLAKETGHTVEEEQKRVMVDGVLGTKDARIDGTTVDVKSASSFSFKKFQSGEFIIDVDDYTLDPFGYKYQLGFYMQAAGDDEGAFLVINKESGEIVSVVLNSLFDIPNVSAKIERERANLESDLPPAEKCYPDEARGKSGNRVLSRQCTFCPHKQRCWSDANDGKGLIEHEYANGTVWFTKIEREPRGKKEEDAAGNTDSTD